MNITLPNNWKPRSYQYPLWNYLRDGGKRACVAWPRRHGKDDVMLHHNACSVFERTGNYWYMLPEYNQCRKAIWDAVNPHTGKKRLEEAFPLSIRSNTLNQEMKILFPNGSTWQLMGSDNYNALVGSPPVGITYSEYAISNPSSWSYLRPILLENGGWAVFNSTPRGKNHFYKLIQMADKSGEWFSEHLTSDVTNLFTPEQLAAELEEMQAEHGEVFGKAIWLQEYFCSFEAAIPGSIWGESIAKISSLGQIKEVLHEEGVPVFTAWDLGRDDYTSIFFFQVIGSEIHVIDFWEGNFMEIPEICQMIKNKKNEYGYSYGTHWVPHDAKPTRLGMGGKSILQQLVEEDVGQFRLTPNMGRDKGIQAGRVTIGRSWFDKEKCGDAVEHLKSYHRKYNEELKKFSDEPVHDEHSHAADAWRYLSIVWKESANIESEVTQMEKFHKGNVIGINYGSLKDDHFAKKRREREYGRN